MQYSSSYHHPQTAPSSPTTLQSRANLKSCLRRGNFSSNRSTRSTSSTILSQPQHQSRGDDDDRTARSAPTTTGSSVMSNSDSDERLFMQLANMLATHHQSGEYSGGTRQLLHYCIPSPRQRQLFLISLRRNKVFLPMFPEPNESPGYALTRYVDRVFGPLLEVEFSEDDSLAMRGGPPSPTRVVHSTVSRQSHGSIRQPLMSSPIRNGPPTPIDVTGNHSVMFSSPNNRQQSIIEQQLGSPANISSPPVDLADDSHGSMLFPPPGVVRETVNKSIDTMPLPVHQPPSPMMPPTLNNSQHFQQKQQVSFPMYSSPDASSVPSTSRNNLPRPHTTATPTTTIATKQSPSFASPSKSTRPLTIGEELNKSSHLQHDPPMNFKSLLNNTSTDTTSVDMLPLHHQESNQILRNASTTTADVAATSTVASNTTGLKDDSVRSKVTTMSYQKFTNKNMLPPITPRENVLYHLPPSGSQVKSSCCSPSNEPPRAKRKRPSYLQLYVKCERSEPYLQPSESMDIVTWYRNGNNQVTADRTLVVRGSTSLLDLIGGIIEAFGLFSDHSDKCMKSNASSPLLMAYKDICFMSDVKSTKGQDGKTTSLTPLPIPGFYYKYVDREVHGRSEMEKESLLSTDPVVLSRTLVSQVLDKPLYESHKNKKEQEDGLRTRLALVYCAPKRDAYVSPRTQKGVLPETIYHFQILLDGIVPEDDLPSSFASQTAIRCVGSTGGVAGGSLIDSEKEIQDLNRTLWGVNDVVGLVHPSKDAQRNLDQIIDILGVPLFDDVGNQTLKELLLDRCIYHIYSGNLSLSMAKKTQRTVEKMQGTSEWLAKGVGAFFSKGITSCVEDDVLFGGDELETSMSRLTVNSSKSRRRRRNSKR